MVKCKKREDIQQKDCRQNRGVIRENKMDDGVDSSRWISNWVLKGQRGK